MMQICLNILLCLPFLYQNKVIYLKENNKVWASLGYDQNGSIPSRNLKLNFGIQLSLGIIGARIFRIISGSSQTGTGDLIA